MKNQAFNMQNELSKPAVEQVNRFLSDKGNIVCDTQTFKEYQDMDVDLFIYGKPNILIEVKCDFCIEKQRQKLLSKDVKPMYLNNKLNIYVEHTSCVESGSLGWFRKSKADWIYYVDYRKNKQCPCYIFKLKELEEYIKMNNPKLITHGDKLENKTKKAYLIPISEIEKLKSYYKAMLPAFKV